MNSKSKHLSKYVLRRGHVQTRCSSRIVLTIVVAATGATIARRRPSDQYRLCKLLMFTKTIVRRYFIILSCLFNLAH